MLNIWFENKTEVNSSNSDAHESFKTHLEYEEFNAGILIFTDLDNDEKLKNGLSTLKSHFHSNCQYRGKLRANSDKFLAQLCYEFMHQDAYLPVMVGANSIYKQLTSSVDDINTLKKVFINKKVDLKHHDEKLEHTGHLAVQKHYSQQQHWNTCEEGCYNFLRLGKLKNQLDVAESIIRDANYIEFDINAVKYSELPENLNAPVTGLTTEEACQLMKYCGMASDLQFVNITGYDSDMDSSGKIGEFISMLLWYFIEGRESSTEYFNGLNKTDFQEYLVQPTHLPIALKFFKHNISGQWWVKLPEELDEKEVVIACSKRDYYQACNDEVSERLMQAISIM